MSSERHCHHRGCHRLLHRLHPGGDTSPQEEVSRQKGKGKKRPRAWHHGPAEDRHFAKAMSLMYPTKRRRRRKKRRG